MPESSEAPDLWFHMSIETAEIDDSNDILPANHQRVHHPKPLEASAQHEDTDPESRSWHGLAQEALALDNGTENYSGTLARMLG
jgi:hypothetical protein